jgi:hypothetical protein
VLVWGVAGDGRRFDLTDEATLASASAGVTIGNDRYINPTAPGEATVMISAAGRQAVLPVNVEGTAQPPDQVHLGRDAGDGEGRL